MNPNNFSSRNGFKKAVKNAISSTYPGKPMHQGMPPFEADGPPLSFFEFWPPRVFYLPIAFHWAWLSLRYGSATLPTITNPLFPVGGLVGESKETVLDQIGGRSRNRVARYIGLTRAAANDVAADRQKAEALMGRADIPYPAVIKPDVGCRGVGVQIIRRSAELEAYLLKFPAGCRLLIQELIPFEGEAGVFYIRCPGEPYGFIFSLTLKYNPFVVGDGRSSLRTLIEQDPRANLIRHVYLKRHRKMLDRIIPAGQNFRLAFTGSHSRGTIFRNGNAYITPHLAHAFDRIADDTPEFHFGRFDVRFQDYRDLQRGHGFKILEINGAGGEATHIWDRKTTLLEAYRTLFEQNEHLFKIAARNRKRGFKPAGPSALWQAYLKEKRLTPQYPHTE